MDYDFRTKGPSPYDYRQQPSSGGLYPRVGQPHHHHHHPVNPTRTSSSSSSGLPQPSSSGLGIRVSIKPQYRITPPPQLPPQIGEIPRSTFQFDFDFEKRILAEADKDKQNWTRLGSENLPSKTPDSTSSSSSSMGSISDPVVSKYVASGLNREAVSLAVVNYGDNPTKVREFVKGYDLLRDMGFSSNDVTEALAMYDNDSEKALAHFLNNSS